MPGPSFIFWLPFCWVEHIVLWSREIKNNCLYQTKSLLPLRPRWKSSGPSCRRSRLRIDESLQDSSGLNTDSRLYEPLSDAKNLAGDDQRAITFLATHESPSANSFLAYADQTIPFSQRKFHVVLGRKFVPLSVLRPYIGERIKSNKDSRPTHLYPFCASALGVSTDL